MSHLHLVSRLPPPHDPDERTRVAWAAAWEVRQYPEGDSRLASFPARGFHHLQLWHPSARISILTPSRLTAGLYEVWPEGGQRSAAETWREVAERLPGIPVPRATEIAALESWFIARDEPSTIRLLRVWWRRARSAVRA